jgi:hypothetical protein
MRPSQDQLRRHFRYDGRTGTLYFRDRPDSDFTPGKYSAARIAAMWRSKFLGKAFGNIDDKGYVRGWYEGRFYRAHQIIWAMHHGTWPEHIDHESGNRANNRLRNLRDATSRINAQNRKRSSLNRSGVVGVRPHGKKWRAAIGNSRDSKSHLGTFDTKAAAIAARRVAEQALNYHPNHGRH